MNRAGDRHRAETVRKPVWARVGNASVGVGGGALLAGAGFEDGGAMAWVGSLLAVPLVLLGVRGWFLRVEVGDRVRVVNWIRIVQVDRRDVRCFACEEGVGYA